MLTLFYHAEIFYLWFSKFIWLSCFSKFISNFLKSSCFRDIAVGDIVTVGECRPLSKTVRYNVLKVLKASGAKKSFDKF